MLNNVFLVACVILVVVSLIWAHADQKREMGDVVYQAKQVLAVAADQALLASNSYKNGALLPAYFGILRATSAIDTLLHGRSVSQLSYWTGYDVEKMQNHYVSFQQKLEDQIARQYELQESFSHMNTLLGRYKKVDTQSQQEQSHSNDSPIRSKPG